MRRIGAFLTAILATTCAADGQRETAPPVASSGSTTAPIVITDPSERKAAVGKLVTVIGTLTRTKIPTVVGIDVDGDYALSDRRVRAVGILHEHVVEPMEPSDVPIATRGPGTYYSLVDPATQELAKPTLYSGP